MAASILQAAIAADGKIIMNMIWTEQLSVGNAILDADHMELFGIGRSIDCITKARDHSALTRAFKLLKDCMERHFLNEELFAHALNIPFAKHQLDHQNILAEIDLTRGELVKDSAVTMYKVEHYAQFLQDWLIKHITEEDLLMKPVLQALPYDFKIDGVSEG